MQRWFRYLGDLEYILSLKQKPKTHLVNLLLIVFFGALEINGVCIRFGT